MEQRQRPVFLTVLCIISYVGLGLSIIGGLMNLLTSQFASKFTPIFTKLSKYSSHNIEYDSMGDVFAFVEKALEQAFNMNLTTILLSIIALIGVLMMWQLKKTGYFLYVGAKVFVLSVPVIFLGVNFFTLISISFSGVFAILFIILYGVNLKHMN